VPPVEEVDGKWSVTEGGRTIEAYSLDTPHAASYIIPYILDAKFGFVTDLSGCPSARRGTRSIWSITPG
jgi:hypothetical protein